MSEYEEIFIGEFTLRRRKDGWLWMLRDDGEAMECNSATEEAIAKLLADFWKENF
mgnify:CR=1 FL=1